MPTDEARRRRWRRNLLLIAPLMAVWAATVFLVCFPPSNASIAYWIGAQGSVLVYLALVCAYVWLMNRPGKQQSPSGKP
ncbi:MAG: DUF4212 domain-containing protein [Candidatus Protistobacter heckmanni]|nr:DUF4212 domain-containing protein [Candidatus Protistobacter heckmanni]